MKKLLIVSLFLLVSTTNAISLNEFTSISADALASLTEPSFNGIGDNDVFETSFIALDDPNFINDLSLHISERSKGKVILQKSSSKNFKYLVMGQAHYLKLLTRGKVIHFVFAPNGGKPFEFDTIE